MCCFQKDPSARKSASELKQHVWIQQNQQRMKKTETYSHDLSSYLRNHPKPSRHSFAEDGDEEDWSLPSSRASTFHPLDYANQSDLTLEEEDRLHPNESQMTLFDDETSMLKGDLVLGLREEEDYITHRFIHTSFGKGNFFFSYNILSLKNRHNLMFFFLFVSGRM